MGVRATGAPGQFAPPQAGQARPPSFDGNKDRSLRYGAQIFGALRFP